jgi:hypothetical protein
MAKLKLKGKDLRNRVTPKPVISIAMNIMEKTSIFRTRSIGNIEVHHSKSK